MSKNENIHNRPLSPHLQIYKPALSMILSILHRITGAALYFASFFFMLWLATAAMGAESFTKMQEFWASPFGIIILMGSSWALVHHTLGGLKHFIWDFGFGFEEHTRHLLSYGVTALSIIITLIIWGLGFSSL